MQRRATDYQIGKDVRVTVILDRDSAGCAETQLEAGEAIEIVTPTGGGWEKA